MVSIEYGPVPAGSRGVVITIADGLAYPRVEGRVRSRRNIPVAGARVSVGLVINRIESGGTATISGASTITDGDGGFQLYHVPRQGVRLQVSGDDLVSKYFEMEGCSNPLAIDISVELRCHFRLVCEGTATAYTRVRFHDIDNNQLGINYVDGTVMKTFYDLPIQNESTGVFSVSEDVHTLSVISGFGEDERVVSTEVVVFSHGQVNEVRIRLQ